MGLLTIFMNRICIEWHKGTALFLDSKLLARIFTLKIINGSGRRTVRRIKLTAEGEVALTALVRGEAMIAAGTTCET